jgi:hypothetical protein
MGRMTVCLLALVLGLPAMGRCEDAKKCCAEKSACSAKKSSACAEKCACCADKATACAAKSACCTQASACQKCPEACGNSLTAQTIDHVKKAAEHLQSAGREAEARELLSQVETLRRDLLALKTAELDRLQVEVDHLRHATGQPRQAYIKLQVVELSLTNMKAKGVSMPEGEMPEAPCACAEEATDLNGLLQSMIGVRLCDRQAVAAFLATAKQAYLLKTVEQPTLIAVDGQPAYFSNCVEVPVRVGDDEPKRFEYRKVGTEVDAVTTLLGDHKIRVHIRPRMISAVPAGKTSEEGYLPHLFTREIDATCEMRLGQTAVIAGSVQKRAESVRIGLIAPKEEVRYNDVQTMYLLSADVIEASQAADDVPTAKAPSSTRTK